MKPRCAVLVAAVLTLTAACSDGAGGSASPPPDTGSTASTASTPPVSPSAPSESAATPVALDAELRDELLLMLERDQGRRLGTAPEETREDREARLGEIFDEHGWPGFDLVGRKAGTAAWAIAQHADLDPAFQAEALELLRTAVDEGQASMGNLAYLEDRVAVATGEPQTYGTQVACAPDGPEPSTPIDDRAGLDVRRDAAGLDPYADYLDEMRDLCAQDS